jgi:hypothetical protein
VKIDILILKNNGTGIGVVDVRQRSGTYDNGKEESG